MWKYINSNELYHAWPKGYKRGPDGTPLGYVSNFKPKDKKSKNIGWDDDIIIKKGTKAYQMTTDNKTIGDKRSFTVDENDRKFYKAHFPFDYDVGLINKDRNKEYKKVKESTYEIKEDLISPSAAKRQKWASELMNNKEVIDECVKVAEAVSVINGLEIANYGDYKTYEDVKKELKEDHQHNIDIITNKPKTDYAKELLDRFKNEPDMLSSFREMAKESLKKEKDERKQLRESIKSINDEADRASTFFSAMSFSNKLKNIYGKKIVEEHYNMSINDIGADFYGNDFRVNAPIIVYNVDKSMKKIKDEKITEIDQECSFGDYLKNIRSIPGSISEKSFVPNVLKNKYGTENYYDNETTMEKILLSNINEDTPNVKEELKKIEKIMKKRKADPIRKYLVRRRGYATGPAIIDGKEEYI